MRGFFVFLLIATLLPLGGCIQRDREEVIEKVEAPLPDQHPFNTRMPRTVAPDQAQRMLATDPSIVLVDVRDGRAWSEGIISGAIHLPENLVASNALREFPNYDARILLYSIPGRGSIQAVITLRKLGYRNVGRLHGNWKQWREAGLPLGPPVTTSRYLHTPAAGDPLVDPDVTLPKQELPFPEEAPVQDVAEPDPESETTEQDEAAVADEEPSKPAPEENPAEDDEPAASNV